MRKIEMLAIKKKPLGRIVLQGSNSQVTVRTWCDERENEELCSREEVS